MKKKWDMSFFIKFLAIVFILNLAFMIFRGGESLFSSDILASDIIVQELHSRWGTIHSYVSQQTFWTLNLPYWLPKYILSLFIHDNILVDKIAILVLNMCLLIVIFIFVAYCCGNKNVGWLTLCVLGCGISKFWIECEVMESAYTIHMLYCFIFLIGGNYLIDNLKKPKTKKYYVILLILNLFIIYILSIDQRYAAIFIAPFCASMLVNTYLECYKVEFVNKIEHKQLRDSLLTVLMILGATLAGLLCNGILKKMLPFIAGLTDVNSFSFASFELFFDNLASFIYNILILWGGVFSTSVSTISCTSFIYLIKTGACFLIMVVIPCKCVLEYKRLSPKLKNLLIFYLIMALELFYIYALSSMNMPGHARYYVYEIPVALIISSWYLWEHMIKPHNLNRYLLILGVVVFGVVSQIDIGYRIKTSEEQYNQREKIVSTLQEYNLTYGYASYWNAQILTSISNGEIKVLPVRLGDVLTPFYDINYIHQFDASEHLGNTFLLLTETEYEDIVKGNNLIYQEIGEPEKIVEAGEYEILIYGYNIAENARYFPYNSLYTPLEGAYRIENIILQESNIIVENVNEVNLVTFPIDIVADSYYKIEFIAQAEIESMDWCYIDFFKEGYDYIDTTRSVPCGGGMADCDVIIYSGEYEDVNDVYMRIVFQNSAPITIPDLKVSLLEVY